MMQICKLRITIREQHYQSLSQQQRCVVMVFSVLPQVGWSSVACQLEGLVRIPLPEQYTKPKSGLSKLAVEPISDPNLIRKMIRII